MVGVDAHISSGQKPRGDEGARLNELSQYPVSSLVPYNNYKVSTEGKSGDLPGLRLAVVPL